jgi:DNA-binding Lrp family transcriptional regulator
VQDAFEDSKQLEDVKEVYLSHGAYDIIAKVSGESLDHLREVVIHRIKNLGSIKSTLILIID